MSRDASLSEIKEAYHCLARVYHPDSNFYTEIIEDDITFENSDAFKQITSAYDTLVDAKRRGEYDETLPVGLQNWEDETNETYIGKHLQAKMRQCSGTHHGNRGRKSTFGVGVEKQTSSFEQELVEEIRSPLLHLRRKHKELIRFLVYMGVGVLIGLVLTFVFRNAF